MKTFNRMLFSDLAVMWRQGLAIATLLACGIAIFVMSTSSIQSLEQSRRQYYRNYRFADVFAQLTRAPQQTSAKLASIPGVARVQTRIVRGVLVDIPNMLEPASCRLVSIESDPTNGLNGVYLRRGRFPLVNSRNEVVASEAFAEAQSLRPGDTLSVNMAGRNESVHIVGIGLSPEYIYAVQPGLMLTDNRRFGILWMPRRQMEAAFNMEGAFNSVSLLLRSGASIDDTIYQTDRILKPFGGSGAFGRHDQESHSRLSDEMHQMRSMAKVTPFIFLMVAAFLSNIVLSRLVHQQKEQIATLRAFGYSRLELALHYLKFPMILVLLGATVGCIAGWRLSIWMTNFYSHFFKFPIVIHEFSYLDAVIAVGIAWTAATAGGISAALRVVRLQPAVAMRPDPPQSFGTSIFDRFGLGWFASPILRMILRRLEANPLSTALSVLGIAMGLAVLVLGSFTEDTIAFVLDVQFGRTQRQDVMLTFNETLSESSLHDVKHLPGVTHVEPFRAVPVRLSNGTREYRLALMGINELPELFRVLDDRNQQVSFPPSGGLSISKKLAELLDVKLGDNLIVDVLETQREPLVAKVSVIFSNYTAPSAYLNRHDLHRLMQESKRLSGAFLAVDSDKLGALYSAVKETPAVAGVLDNNAARMNFRNLVRENTRVMRIVNAIFGAIIAVGVIYNAALITLAESGRDLATLRVIGFSRREVAYILIGELAVLTLCAIPVGLPIGYGFAYLASIFLDTESHRFPLIVQRYTFAYATAIILLAAIASTIAVRRMLDRLNLIAVLKVKVS